MIQKLSTVPSAARLARSGVLADAPQAEFTARWIDSVDELESLQPAWERLMDVAIHRNLMFDPDFLIPAFRHLADKSVRILVIEATPKNQPHGTPVICGLLPLQTKRVYGLPLASLEIWLHEQCVDGTPLLRFDCAKQSLEFLIDFLAETEMTKLLSLPMVSNSGEFANLLTDLLYARGIKAFQRDSFTRACFLPEADASTYFDLHVSSSVQRTQRRLTRRLEETGELSVTCYCEADDSDSMLEQFLQVEASGWKAETGTALRSRPSSEGFFREMVTRSMHHGKLSFLAVELNGQPISMLCDLVAGDSRYSFKTAFDDNYKEYSPGMMAELRNIESMHDNGVTFVDSCTLPNNETINRIWGGRIRFQSLVIPLRGKLSQWAVAALPILQQLRHANG